MSRDLDADIYGPHIAWREYSFMSNPRLAQAVLDSVVMLEVCQVCAPAPGVHNSLQQAVLGQCDHAWGVRTCLLAQSVHCRSVHLKTEQAPGWEADIQPCVGQC